MNSIQTIRYLSIEKLSRDFIVLATRALPHYAPKVEMCVIPLRYNMLMNCPNLNETYDFHYKGRGISICMNGKTKKINERRIKRSRQWLRTIYLMELNGKEIKPSYKYLA